MISKKLKARIITVTSIMCMTSSLALCANAKYKQMKQSQVSKANAQLHKAINNTNMLCDNELDEESSIPVTAIDPSITSEELQCSSSNVSATGDEIKDKAFGKEETNNSPQYVEVYSQRNVNGEQVLAPNFIENKSKQKEDINDIMTSARCGQFYSNQVVHIDFKLDDTNTDVPINANVNNPNGDNIQDRLNKQANEEQLDSLATTQQTSEQTNVSVLGRKSFSTKHGKGATVRYSGENGNHDLNGNRKSESFRRITKHVGLNTYSDWYVDPEIFNSSDVEVMARLIYSEAGNEPYEGKIAVGSVIMNRVHASGCTLRDIVFQRKQFFGTQTKWFKTKPNKESYKAAQETLNGVNNVPTSMKFADLRICNPKWAHEYKFIRRIGNHWFFE